MISTGLSNDLGYVLWQAQHQLKRDLENRLAELRLTLPQFAALAHLHDHPGLPAAALSRLLPLTPQAVSNLVVRLEVVGYLSRGTPTGGRNQPLSLTSTGRSALEEALTLVQDQQDRFFAALRPGQRDAVRAALSACLDPETTPVDRTATMGSMASSS